MNHARGWISNIGIWTTRGWISNIGIWTTRGWISNICIWTTRGWISNIGIWTTSGWISNIGIWTTRDWISNIGAWTTRGWISNKRSKTVIGDNHLLNQFKVLKKSHEKFVFCQRWLNSNDSIAMIFRHLTHGNWFNWFWNHVYFSYL